MKTNDMDRDLDYSKQHAEFFSAVYRALWPDLRGIADCTGYMHMQELGIDTVLTLGSGRTVAVDDKARRGMSRDDILFEFEIVQDGEVRDSWIRKDLAIDFVAYGYPECAFPVCHIIPWEPLHSAFREHGGDWIRQYGVITVNNNRGHSTWETRCVAVPNQVVFQGRVRAVRVELREKVGGYNVVRVKYPPPVLPGMEMMKGATK